MLEESTKLTQNAEIQHLRSQIQQKSDNLDEIKKDKMLLISEKSKLEETI